ncbi:hypothetical protein HWV62_44478, partial [Athelia sp. TMB]
FADAGADALGLGGLDISFDAAPADPSRIRVKIHSPPSSTQPPSRSRASSAASQHPLASPFMAHAYPDGDPFFGVGSLASPMHLPASIGEFATPNGYGSSLFSVGPGPAARSPPPAAPRRVRISLKSVPTAPTDGGEWEVEVR